MSAFRPIIVGDIVEVYLIVAHGPDKWIPAKVIYSDWTQFTVKAFNGAFDGDGHKEMQLPQDGA